MTAPEWFCPPGHPRETQLRRQWADLSHERRTGGRARRPVFALTEGDAA